VLQELSDSAEMDLRTIMDFPQLVARLSSATFQGRRVVRLTTDESGLGRWR
jgi:hypothetical protein